MVVGNNAHRIAPGVVLQDIQPGCRVRIVLYIDRICVLLTEDLPDIKVLDTERERRDNASVSVVNDARNCKAHRDNRALDALMGLQSPLDRLLEHLRQRDESEGPRLTPELGSVH